MGKFWQINGNYFIFQEYCLLRRCLLRQVFAQGRVGCTDCYCMLYKCYINNFYNILLVFIKYRVITAFD